MHFIYLALAGLAPMAMAATKNFMLDCTDVAEPCNNDCFAVYTAGKPTTLNYLGPNMDGPNRKASGCTKSPCTNKKLHYMNSGTSCDEYPYASNKEGGTGAILRCVDVTQNKKEGSLLGAFYKKTDANGGCANKACTFTIFFKNAGNVGYCSSKKGAANDGYEFKLNSAGNFVNARDSMIRGMTRDSINVTSSEHEFEPEVPDESLFVPLHLRREFELDDGSRVLMGSADQEINVIGTMIADGEENSSPHIIVRELFGDEKSEAFRPPKDVEA